MLTIYCMSIITQLLFIFTTFCKYNCTKTFLDWRFIMKFYITIFLILSLIFPCFCYAYYGPTEYVWSDNTVETSTNEEAGDFLDLTCESAVLIEQTTGKVLYEKDPHASLRPASVTKIMTILLIMEALDNGQITYDTQITASEEAANMGGSQIWLEVRRIFKC